MIRTGEQYREGLRDGREVWLDGERVGDITRHPATRPIIDVRARMYDMQHDDAFASVLTYAEDNTRHSIFNRLPREQQDWHDKRRAVDAVLNDIKGVVTRVGDETVGEMWSLYDGRDVLNEIDPRFGENIARHIQAVIETDVFHVSANTDPKGDRSKAPHQQSDPDLFLHVVRRDDNGIYVSGAKMHQTGAINSHWLIFMPTMRMSEADRDWSVVGAVRVDAPGLTYIVGRQTNDTRIVDGGAIDAGNANFAGQESLIVFEDVFVPYEHVFMDGEWEFATSLVERFTTYHRSSYVCKTGLGDVLIGAAASAAEYNGVEAASHIKDKLVEMTHLNETIYSSCMAGAHQSKPVASGAYINDEMLSNVAKHNVTRFPFEIARLAQDIAGGLVVTMPSEKDLQNNEIGPLIRKFLQGKDGVEVTDRMRILRLIENMTIGRNAVGYLTESLHGAGSPQAQRIQIARAMKIEDKKSRARTLAGVNQSAK
jgi:4-hydroxybutyryl-CoA dehydratase / vinylacetyl-CoA-Delta-isomerase